MPTRTAQTEVNLLSAILRQKDMITPVKIAITADMFYSYREEFDWLSRYYLKYRRVPSKGVFRNRFPGTRLKAVDDVVFLCEEVKRSHLVRSLKDDMQNWAQLLMDGDVDAAVTDMHRRVMQTAANIGVYNDSDIFVDDEDIVAEMMSTVERAADTGMAGIPLGFDSFDARTGGFMPGTLNVIAARTGQGKSWTLAKGATTAVVMDHKVMFNSLEMPRFQVAYRCYSLLASTGGAIFDNVDLMRGTGFDPVDFKEFLVRLKKRIHGALHINDRVRGTVTPLVIAAQIERNNPDIVFVDYVQLMGTRGEKNWQSLGDLSGELKGLAMEHRIPIVVASQVNRERGITKKGSPPNADSISGSDMIGHDADVVVTHNQYSKRVLTYLLAKNRNGHDGAKWWVHMDPSKGIYEEISHDRADELRDEDADLEERSS